MVLEVILIPVSSNVEEWNTKYTKKNLSYMNFKELNETFN